MLHVSELTDYVSVINTYMACRPDETMSGTSLAKHVLLPLTTVKKLLQMLVKSGLLSSRLGKQGGANMRKRSERWDTLWQQNDKT
jgi:DNA-binding IscR family transcriptional regulator